MNVTKMTLLKTKDDILEMICTVACTGFFSGGGKSPEGKNEALNFFLLAMVFLSP